MSATDTLREDHKQIRRLEKLIIQCYTRLYAGNNVPLSDIEKITIIIEEFLDSIHYSREEDSYFPCVVTYDHLKKEIKELLIEHEFSRRISHKIKYYLKKWKDGENSREPVARYLKTYSIYLKDHMAKEENFFEKAEFEILSKEEEQDMYEQFKSVMTISKKLDDMLREIDLLENQPWAKT